jgi:glucose/arabinose dehydrogenase
VVRSVALLTAVYLLAGGCASFPDEPAPTQWSAQPQLTPQAGPKPELPGEYRPTPGEPGRNPAPQSVPPPQGCKDYHPAVVATCLNTVTGVAPIGADAQGGVAAYATERGGRLVKVTKDVDPVVIAQLEVDASADGGLTGLALSATFAEDQLAYVYVTTATDNRVLRIAPGDTPKPILTGIPKGPSGNRGVLASDRKGAILVATGDAGNPALAADPNSLAGKVLRIDTFGRAVGASPVYSRGHRDVTALCQAPSTDPQGQPMYATDAALQGPDELDAITEGGDYGAGGRPPVAEVSAEEGGLGGCAATTGGVFLGAMDGQRVRALTIDGNGAVTGDPQEFLAGQYGRLRTVVLDAEGALWITTSNRDGIGTPTADDDRVLRIQPPTTTGSSPL